MAEVDPEDDAITRHVLFRHGWDPERHERRWKLVAAYDDHAELVEAFASEEAAREQRRAAGETVEASEQNRNELWRPVTGASTCAGAASTMRCVAGSPSMQSSSASGRCHATSASCASSASRPVGHRGEVHVSPGGAEGGGRVWRVSEDRRQEHVRVRREFGLRTDREWVDWVAEHGTDGGTMMMLPIPLADDEIAELQDRNERAMRTIGAFTAARLASAAGAWLDQRAGGVVRLLLAHPDPTERTVAEGIVAEHGGTVELVEHSTRELEHVDALILDEVQTNAAFGDAATAWHTEVQTNVVRLTLRGDLNPELPEGLRAAVTAGTLIIEQPTEPAGWDPRASSSTEAGARTVAPDEPRPRWPGDDETDLWNHWYRCVQYVADRHVGGPLVDARHLAETIGLSVRVIYPGQGHTQNLCTGRATMWVNAEHIVRVVSAE